MSQISLSGNAGGSGTFTIASPNSNNSRTLTLPDQTGTVLTGSGAIGVNASAPNNSLVLDASGNVGIGTSSPVYRLDVRGGSAAIINSAADPTLFVGEGLGVNEYGFLRWDRTNNILKVATQANPITFGSDATEWMRIDSSGNLLVGTTSAAGRITSLVTNGGVALATTNTSGTGLYYGAIFHNNGTTYTSVGSISVSGSATAYNTTSDYRLKNITGPITNSGAYIDSLNPVEGTWKADGSVFVGLIAHEVQEVSRTQVATGVKDGEQMQGMDYSAAEIIANLIAEVKSLRARMAQLEMKGA